MKSNICAKKQLIFKKANLLWLLGLCGWGFYVSSWKRKW